MSESTVGVIRKDGPAEKPYCLHFSDGRKECFASEDKAKKREEQVKFFKNKANRKIDLSELALAKMGVFAELMNEEQNATFFLVENSGEAVMYVAKGNGDNVEVSLADMTLEENQKVISIMVSSAATPPTSLTLSNVIIDGQLIANSHTHSVTLDKNGFGETDEVDGHKHYVEWYSGNAYVSSAPVNVAGINIMHSHMIIVNAKVVV